MIADREFSDENSTFDAGIEKVSACFCGLTLFSYRYHYLKQRKPCGHSRSGKKNTMSTKEKEEI